MLERPANIVIKGARLIFKNFSGKDEKFLHDGTRHFGLVIEDPEHVEKLIKEGWNVKEFVPKGQEPGEEVSICYIDVKISFDIVPPVVKLVGRHGPVPITEDEIHMLDDVEIINADVAVRPYVWSVNGNEGIKAYLKTLYVTIGEDEFAADYEDVGVFD